MADWGIKVSQPGYSVLSANPDELVFSSKYKTLRVKSQGSGTITQSGGRMVTIAHNLGYVPYFVVHATPDPYMGGFFEDDYFVHPIVPIVAGAQHLERHVYAYADDTNLYIKLGADFGYRFFHTAMNDEDYAYQSSVIGTFTGLAFVGRDDPDFGDEKGAIRFQNVNISQGTTVSEAVLFFYCESRLGSGNIKYKTWGIDEDNTGGFDAETFARTKTTAYEQSDAANPSQGGYETPTVTAIVNEILGRGGWSSGNHMGFLLFDNGTVGNNDFGTAEAGGFNPYGSPSYLRVITLENLCTYKYTIFYNKIE